MSEPKDPKLKLFGKTIQLPAVKAPAPSIGPISAPCGESVTEEHSSADPPCSPSPMLEDNNLNADKDVELTESLSEPKEGDAAKEEEDQSTPMISSDDPKDPVADDKSPAGDDSNKGSPKTSKGEEGNNETSNSQDKTLKKPDKIIPCPRCNSMETKFCYFNNYNVNQPRHFCKNCQRYWTAGGSMRNVPVGAGRRKNKNSLSQFRHITVPEGSRLDLVANGNHHPTLNLNGTVLTFSSDGPLCESMASVLSIADKTMQSNPRNGYHKPEEHGIPVSSPKVISKENGGEDLSGLSTMSNGSASCHELGKNGLPELASNHHHHPFPWSYPGASPWPAYPWTSVPWNPLMPPNTAFRPSTFPIPFYTTPTPPYWGGGSASAAWNVPWIIPPNPSSQSQALSGSGPDSPLGKHSRDGNAITPGSSKEDSSIIKEGDREENIPLVPKTLRIDNPEEAAKSSIWVTLGIKNDANDSFRGSRMFKAFQGQQQHQQQSKGDEKDRVSETSTVLQANPAALSRSLSFHESS